MNNPETKLCPIKVYYWHCPKCGAANEEESRKNIVRCLACGEYFDVEEGCKK